MAGSKTGAKRLVVGAHYGLRDWMAQRVTAVVMAVYSVVLLLCVLMMEDRGYYSWAGLFAQDWMRVATLVALLALFYHAWVGVRDIWMDYVKPLAVRLTLQVLTILWLVGCAAWAVRVLWRV